MARSNIRRHQGSTVLVVALVMTIVAACDSTSEGSPAGPDGGLDGGPGGGHPIDASICQGAGRSIDLGCAAPPDTFAFNGPEATGMDAGPPSTAWDTWAWNSFVAYNWPALASDAGATGYVRGVPDTHRSLSDAGPNDMLVWETFKEKREVFNIAAEQNAWQDLTYAAEYAPEFLGGMVQPCSGIDSERLARVKARPRVVAQISKQPPLANFDGLDETAEVASPAQESQDALCAGYTGEPETLCRMFHAPPPDGGAMTDYSASDPNHRTPVGPRVFKGAPSASRFVYYEVKVNWDYYYRLGRFGSTTG